MTREQKKTFLLKQMEILRKKATDMTVGNYYALYNYYMRKIERLEIPPMFDNAIPLNLNSDGHECN